MSVRDWKRRQRRVAKTQRQLAGNLESWSNGLVETLESTGVAGHAWRDVMPDFLRGCGVLLDHRLFDYQEAINARELQQQVLWSLRRERDERADALYEIAKRRRELVRGLVGPGIERMLFGEGRTPRPGPTLSEWVKSFLLRIRSSEMRKLLEGCQGADFDWDEATREIEPALTRLDESLRDVVETEQAETEAVRARHTAKAALDSTQVAVHRVLKGVAMLAT